MLTGLLLGVFVLVSILLIVIILVQPHYSESGLAGAFGGGGSDSFLGVKAISVASKITIGLAVVFLLLSIVLNKLPPPSSSGRSIIKPDAPKAAPASESSSTAPQAPSTATGPEQPVTATPTNTAPALPPVPPQPPVTKPPEPKAPEPPKPDSNIPPQPEKPEPPKPPAPSGR
ncbi:MAG: preprotein translocase subunit SecG [Candidatus Brocadiia bacterium]